MIRGNSCVKVGDIVKVTGNSNSNDYCIGKEYEVLSVDDGSIRCKDIDTGRKGNHLSMKDFVISTAGSRERITKQLNELKAEVAELQARLDWMDEIGTDSYNPTEHKVWSALNAVENDSLSKMEKVKLIASLVNKV